MDKETYYKVLYKCDESSVINCEVYENKNEAHGRYLILSLDYDYAEILEQIITHKSLYKKGR